MAGRIQKPWDQLQDQRPSRRRPVLYVRTAEEQAAFVAELNRLYASPKSLVAQAKPRDARGRFVKGEAT